MDSADQTNRRGLRLIRGGLDRAELGPEALQLVVSPETDPPFPIEAMVVEDDTYLVLGASPEVREPVESPLRLWTELHETEPADPGGAVFRPGRPPRISAVVHDLSQDPTWTEAWVVAALAASLDCVGERSYRDLGLQPLGCVHGKLKRDRFVQLLRRALRTAESSSLRRIWLVGDPRRYDLSRIDEAEEPGQYHSP
jgi:hypothetical protein